MIEFGPHWYNSKTTCANTVNAVLDDDIECTTSKHGWNKVEFATQHGSLCVYYAARIANTAGLPQGFAYIAL